MRKTAIVWVLLISTLWAAQGTHRRNTSVGASAHLPPAAIAAMQKIDPERIRAHVKFLSSDLLEGRGTGQRGGEIAAAYIATQFGTIRAETCRRSRHLYAEGADGGSHDLA